MDVKVIYNNQLIRNSTTDDTFTLPCNGKIMATDVVIQATDVSDLTVTYGGVTILSTSGTVTKTLTCEGKVMSGDIGVSVTAGGTPTGETWYFNSTISGNAFSASVNFTTRDANGAQISCNKIEFAKPTMFRVNIKYYVGETATTVYSAVGSSTFWGSDNYRTVTFETSPTGDLLTFLQANATKL